MSSEGTTLPPARSKTDPTLKPNFTYEEMWAAIDAEMEKNTRQLGPGEFTQAMFAERYGIGEKDADNRIMHLLHTGLLEKREKALVNGRLRAVYAAVTKG
jgi:hypothetical protein